MTGSAAILGINNVTKSFTTPYERVEVLRGLNLIVHEREFVAITGPSGSGKSTCLHIAALLDRPTSGTVLFDGQDVSTLAEPELCDLRKRKVGMVFQKYCLLLHRTVIDNVMFRFRYLDHDATDSRNRVARALEIMNLAAVAHRPARVLSGGEMQRVAIARAIAYEPRLLIADEPTGNLDRASALDVMECLRELNLAGITILLVTHNEGLLGFCSRHLKLARSGCFEN